MSRAKTIRSWAGLGLGVVLCLGSAPARSEDRVLIVGINAYQNLGKGAQLTGSVNDANLMADFVVRQWGFKREQVKVLLDGEATADAIKSAMTTWLVKGTSHGDRVLFYYSGHGYFIADKTGDEPDGRDETLVASDAKSTGTEFINMVTDDDIKKRLDLLEGRSVMVIADSCHSGTLTRSLDPTQQPGDEISRTPLSWAPPSEDLAETGDRAPGDPTSGQTEVSEEEFTRLRNGNSIFRSTIHLRSWTAASPTEAAQEDVTQEPRHGVFTKAFVTGVEGRAADGNKDGRVSATELWQYVRTQAKTYCTNNRCKTGMTPLFEGGDADFTRDMLVWARPGVDPAPVTPVVIKPEPVNPNPGDLQPTADPAILIPPDLSDGSVKVEILPKGKIRLGQKIKIRVTSAKPGYVFALDMRDNNQVMQLFPSVCSHKERDVRANAPLTIPDPSYGCSFDATEVGTGQIVVVVSQDNVALDALLDRNKALEVIPDANAYLAEITRALLGVWTGDARNRPVKWALGSVRYEIKP